jgi:hypothetical protein
MQKQKLIEKLKKLYELGKSDYSSEVFNSIENNQDTLIEEMAENIIQSFNGSID